MVHRTILTYDGLQSAPDDGLRRELLGGELYVSPAPSPLHQDIVGEVFVVLRDYAALSGGKAYVSPIDVVFSQIDAVQPDVVYFAPDRLSLIGAKNVQGAPSLVVEVLSPLSSNVDPGLKLETYARYGVPEYWIVDSKARTITAHADPSGNRYLQTSHAAGAAIDSLTLPNLTFSLP